jgi:hypothetical protein
MQQEFRSFKDLASSIGLEPEEGVSPRRSSLPCLQVPGRYTSSSLLDFLRDQCAPESVAACPLGPSPGLMPELLVHAREQANTVYAVSRGGGRLEASGFESKAVTVMTALNPQLRIEPEPAASNCRLLATQIR